MKWLLIGVAIGLLYTIPYAFGQNCCAGAPDTRPNRDHSSTLDYDTHRRKLASCMVELSTIKDAELRRFCLVQSKRMP